MQPQRRHLGLAPWQWVALLGSCFIVLILTLNPRGAGEAHAYTITGGISDSSSTQALLDVQLVCADADYNNHFGLYAAEDSTHQHPQRIYLLLQECAPRRRLLRGDFWPGRTGVHAYHAVRRRCAQRKPDLLHRPRQPEPRRLPARSYHLYFRPHNRPDWVGGPVGRRRSGLQRLRRKRHHH